METFVLCVCGAYLLGYMSLMVLLLIVVKRGEQAASKILQAKNGSEFWTSFHSFINNYCSRHMKPREVKPSAEYENDSFFHHFYLPMQDEKMEKNTIAYKKTLKQLVIMCAAGLAIEIFLLIISQNPLLFYLILLVLLLLITGVATFLWLPRLGKQMVELLREVDKKLMGIGNGTEPPPYRVPLQAVMQQQSR